MAALTRIERDCDVKTHAKSRSHIRANAATRGGKSSGDCAASSWEGSLITHPPRLSHGIAAANEARVSRALLAVPGYGRGPRCLRLPAVNVQHLSILSLLLQHVSLPQQQQLFDGGMKAVLQDLQPLPSVGADARVPVIKVPTRDGHEGRGGINA